MAPQDIGVAFATVTVGHEPGVSFPASSAPASLTSFENSRSYRRRRGARPPHGLAMLPAWKDEFNTDLLQFLKS